MHGCMRARERAVVARGCACSPLPHDAGVADVECV
eukprot:COSAG02_NODE_41906_length_389_cov_1.541379_1_plen_34_part_01